MLNIQPKTYNEVVRLKRCMTLKNVVQGIDETMLKKLYDFMGESKSHEISVSGDGMLSFLQDGQVLESVQLQTTGNLGHALLTAYTLQIVPLNTGGSGSDSSGSSNNNNNNNNNNNG